MLVLDRIKTVKSCRCPKKVVRFGWYHSNSPQSPSSPSPSKSPSCFVAEEGRAGKEDSCDNTSSLLEASGVTSTSCFLWRNYNKNRKEQDCEDGSKDLFHGNQEEEEEEEEDDDIEDPYDEDEEEDDEQDEEDEQQEGCKEHPKRQKQRDLSQTYTLVYNHEADKNKTICQPLSLSDRDILGKRSNSSSSSRQIATYV